jgi:chromosome segregation ATPase
MGKRTGLIAYIAVFLPIAAHSQSIYICKDAAGKTFTSDRLLSECAGRAVREMDKNGMVRREIPAPLTLEQKRQKHAEEERIKAEAEAAEQQKQADRAMLARYRNENDIADARRRTLELVQDQITRESGALATAEKDKKEVQQKLEQFGNKKPVPPFLQAKLTEGDQSIAAIKKKIAGYQAEAAQINLKFDATLKRYRELTGGTAAVASVSASLPSSVPPKPVPAAVPVAVK